MLKRMNFAALAIALAVAGMAHAGELGLPAAEPESVGMSSEGLAQVQARLQPFVDRGQLPGFVTVAARDGKVVHFEAFGHMDVERDKPMQTDTIFRMYSMTKPITGVAVMALVDDGAVSLDDPVSKYIPEFADIKVLETAADGSTKIVPANTTMTVEHLMTHTSGLVYAEFDTGPIGEAYREHGVNWENTSNVSLEEFAQRLAKAPLASHPGAQWNYGLSMDVLGRVVEVASGKRYGDFLEERIFAPLGMVDSGFHVPESKQDRFAANYGPDAEKTMVLVDDPANSPYLNVPSIDAGGAGMVATASDYLRFAQMLLNGGELDGVRIISEASAEAITTNQLPAELGSAPLSTLNIADSALRISFEGIGFGYCGAVPMPGYGATIFGGEGEYTWGGYASTDFWIDKHENVVGMVLTQLIPTGTYPTRPIAYMAIEQAIVDRRHRTDTDD